MSQGLSLTGLLLRAMRIACLLLSCAAALSRAGLIVEDGKPVLWDHATSLVTDLPISPEGLYTPDPWNYLHRMNLYRIIIANTNAYMTSMGPGETQSPLWGMPLQLSWMITSGRLADPTGATTCGVQASALREMCISPSSWWACVNYFNSALPFLSAAKSGILGDGVNVFYVSPVVADGYCTTYESCLQAHPTAMYHWDALYNGMRDPNLAMLPDNEKKDKLLGLYWNASRASTHDSAVCNSLLSPAYYSDVERTFAEDWLNSAEYVAAVHFQSSLEMAPKFMRSLPGRVLQTGDNPGDIADLTDEENSSLKIYSWMKTIEGYTGASLVGLWRNSMCSRERRESGRVLLEELMINHTTSGFLSFFSTTMTTQCN